MDEKKAPAEVKEEVRRYWDRRACGTEHGKSEKFSREYFDEIEEKRYSIEKEIFSFAEFTRFHGKRVLEVGVGAGSDFTQWVRAGAEAYGVDLTQEAVDHVKHRLAVYGLEAADFKVSDAENLPFEDNFFDLVYSWGVIHHTPDTEKAFSEIVRVTKPGGRIKLMLYNRRSLWAFWLWAQHALLKGRPFQSFGKVIYYHMESLGTKAYTRKEVRAMAAAHPVGITRIRTPVNEYELYKYKPVLRTIAYLLACIFGFETAGWFMMIDYVKESE